MPTNQKVKRSNLIKNLLISKGHGLTVSEIVRELSIPHDQKKFISSGLIGWLKLGKVTKVKAVCSVTNRNVDLYSWAHKHPAPTAEELSELDAQRQAAANDLAAMEAFRSAQTALDLTRRAYLEFEKLTGCRLRGEDDVRAAYQAAALRLNPDNGGDGEMFVRLANAWECIKRAQEFND